jgi:hypothetical protein
MPYVDARAMLFSAETAQLRRRFSIILPLHWMINKMDSVGELLIAAGHTDRMNPLVAHV